MSFQELKVYTAERWQPSGGYPSLDHGFLALHSEGGVPGKDPLHSPVRRWKSPVAGWVSVGGRISHEGRDGEPMMVRVVSSRGGVLSEMALEPGADAIVALEKLEVQVGDTVDFVVESQSGGYRDGFKWRIEMRHREGASSAEDLWESGRDFASRRELVFYRLVRDGVWRPLPGLERGGRSLKGLRESIRRWQAEVGGVLPGAKVVPKPASAERRPEASGRPAPVQPAPGVRAGAARPGN